MEITGILRGSSEAWNHKFNLIGVSLTKPMLPLPDRDETNRTAAMFGYWGGGVNIVDGKYSYFCYPKDMLNQDLYQYTRGCPGRC